MFTHFGRKRRPLNSTELTLDNTLFYAATQHCADGDPVKLAICGESMDEHKDFFWDYTTFALLVTGESAGVRPRTWKTRSAEELSSILTPITAAPEAAARIRAVVDVVSEAIKDRDGAMPEAMKAGQAGAFLLEITFAIFCITTSRTASDKAAVSLMQRRVHQITYRYRDAKKNAVHLPGTAVMSAVA